MSKEKLDYIDAIRGLAVILVIAVHVGQSIPNLPDTIKNISKMGQFGVQIFFAASALTLCISASNEDFKLRSAIAFYLRRFFRIWPMYMIGIIIYFSIFRMKCNSNLYHDCQEPYIFENILSNIFLAHAFFPSANNAIVPGGWSIATEVVFYLLFPLIWTKIFGGKKEAISRFELLAKVALLQVGSYVVLNQIQTQLALDFKNNEFLYFSLPFQMIAFISGFIAYEIVKKRTDRTSIAMLALPYIAISCLISLVAGILLDSFLVPMLSLASAASLLTIIGFSKIKEPPKTLIKVGRYSYSMYIVHFIFATYATRWFYRHFNLIPDGVIGFIFSFIFTILFSYLLSLLTWKFVEKPGISAGRHLIKRLV